MFLIFLVFLLIVLITPLCFPRPFWLLIASKQRWLRPDGIHHFSYVEANLDNRPRPRKLRSALEGSKDPLGGINRVGELSLVHAGFMSLVHAGFVSLVHAGVSSSFEYRSCSTKR